MERPFKSKSIKIPDYGGNRDTMASGNGFKARQFRTGLDDAVLYIVRTSLVMLDARNFFIKCLMAARAKKSSFMNNSRNRMGVPVP